MFTALRVAALAAFGVVGALAANTNETVSLLAAKQGFQACPTAPSNPQDRRLNTSKLTYATFNTEFMFLVGYGSLKCPGADCKWSTVADAKLHIKQVASIIHELNADILQLNEVEDCAVLAALIAELQNLGDATYKGYLVRGTDTSTGENAALLTRVDPVQDLQRSAMKVSLPVANSTCPQTSGYSKTKGVTKHFLTSFQVKGFSKPITVIGAHLLAQPTNKPRCVEREGQAQVLATLARQAVAQGHHVIVSGDLNDWSRTAIDRNNNAPISNALGILEADNFENVGALVPQAERYSQWWDRNNDCVYVMTEVSILDHIVISPSLRNSVVSAAYRHDLDQASCSGYNSDHYPVTVTLSPA